MAPQDAQNEKQTPPVKESTLVTESTLAPESTSAAESALTAMPVGAAVAAQSNETIDQHY